MKTQLHASMKAVSQIFSVSAWYIYDRIHHFEIAFRLCYYQPDYLVDYLWKLLDTSRNHHCPIPFSGPACEFI